MKLVFKKELEKELERRCVMNEEECCVVNKSLVYKVYIDKTTRVHMTTRVHKFI